MDLNESLDFLWQFATLGIQIEIASLFLFSDTNRIYGILAGEAQKTSGKPCSEEIA